MSQLVHSSLARRAPARARRRSSGFSLVEVLVSIVVLSFGLLGMVGLQATALKQSRDASLQTVAVSFARELAEMMRANPQVAAAAGTANPYLGTYSVAAAAGGVMAPATTSSCLNVGSSCADTTALANAQMTDWLARVSAALPGARVTICQDTTPYDTTGLPVWSCTAPTAAADNIAFIKLGWTRQDTQNDIQLATGANAQPPFVVLPVTPGGQL